MKPATSQPADTHPRTSTPSQPGRYPHEPDRLVTDLPDTAMAPGYTGTFGGRAEDAARVRRKIAGYLRDCPGTDDMVLIASWPPTPSSTPGPGAAHSTSAASCPPALPGSR